MSNENDIQKELKERLDNAIQLQIEIEKLIGKALEELKKVSELTQKFEELGKKVEEEEKEEPEVIPEFEVGVEAKPEVPEVEEEEDAGVDFEHELAKVRKIKEMLDRREVAEAEEEEPAVEEKAAEEKVEVEFGPAEAAEEPAEEAPKEEGIPVEAQEISEAVEPPSIEEEREEEIEEKPQPEEEKVPEIEVEVHSAYMDKEEEVKEEPKPEEEKVLEIEERETVEILPEEKGKEEAIEEKPSLEEEKGPDIQVGEGVKPPPTEIEIEKAIEEEPLPTEGKEPVIEGSETMETILSGRWKRHWKDRVVAAEGKEEEKEEAPAGAEPLPEEKKEEPSVPKAEDTQFLGRRASDAASTLEQYKKTEAPEEGTEIYYYEKDDKIILDSESIIQSLSSNLEEARKLFIKLSQTEAPKDQFFVKQEIIRHQEAVRGVILACVKMLEKESCSLPKFTTEIVNASFIKEILGKLSMENWSNQDDFTFFDEYSVRLKKDFYERITPKVNYLRAIIEELEIQ